MKKIIKIGLIIALSFSIVACSDKKGSSDFEAWSATLSAQLLGNSDYILYSLFDDPKNVGIDMDVDGLTIVTKEDYEEDIKEYKALLKQLRTHDYDVLNDDQKITYDVLEETFTSMINQKDDFYLNTNYFDVNDGVQSGLTLNISFMDLQSEEVIEAIIAVMKSCKEMFPKYVAFEEERQEHGYGMSKTYMAEVIEQVETFNKGDHTYVIDSLNEKIENASYLDKNAKTAYKKAVKDAYDNYLIPAFKQLETSLKQVKIKTSDVDASLADYKGGKEYYRKLVYDTTGFSTVDAFDAFLSEQEDKVTDRLITLLNKYPSLYKTLQEDSMPASDYTDLNSANEVLAYLEKMVNESGDYPKVENIKYTMEMVPSALENIFSASAAYFIGPFDDPDCDETMVLNGSFTQDDYTTIAHEGFPGHMYQYRYFKNVEHNVLRDILGNGGYSEGWAVYASHESNAYSNDPAVNEYLSLNDDLVYIYIMRMDIMIHYDNASRNEIYSYLKTNFGLEDETALKETYEQVLLDPTIFFPYYGYYFRLLDLKEAMQEEWGHSYSDYKFHKAVLDLGALSYPLLENYIYEMN